MHNLLTPSVTGSIKDGSINILFHHQQSNSKEYEKHGKSDVHDRSGPPRDQNKNTLKSPDIF